jgi:hypothetical protein
MVALGLRPPLQSFPGHLHLLAVGEGRSPRQHGMEGSAAQHLHGDGDQPRRRCRLPARAAVCALPGAVRLVVHSHAVRYVGGLRSLQMAKGNHGPCLNFTSRRGVPLRASCAVHRHPISTCAVLHSAQAVLIQPHGASYRTAAVSRQPYPT